MSNENHPGHESGCCPLRYDVSSHRTDGCGGGYGCSVTGGHCIPSEGCDELRAAYNEAMYCDSCGTYPADYPSKLCVGCEAYMEHTQ